MNELSCELTENIFSFLSQRYLYRASMVCKKWLKITRRPKYFESVELHSTSQIEKFIEFIQTVIINDTPISHYIKEIIFYDQYIHNLNPYRLVALINLCPFVIHVDNIPDIGEENYKVLSDTNYWRHLKILPLSYTKMDKRWMDHMKKVSNDKYKVTSLSIDVSQYTLVPIEEYSNMETDDERNYKLLKIEDQRNRGLSRRYNDSNRSMLSFVYFSSYYLKLPTSLANLKELHLNFETYNKKHNLCCYEFNEKTLDSISTSCSSLTHLTLLKFNFNISNTFGNQPNVTLSSTTIIKNTIPSPQLVSLRLQFCYLHSPNCYTYIQYKYPNLTTLNLILGYIPEMNKCYTEYKSTIGNLITSYDSLTDLQIQYAPNVVQNMDEQKHWPHTELLTWLITHPNQLTTFRYPFNLFTIEREDNDWETALAIKNSLTDEQRSQLLPQYCNYLQNLKSLELIFDFIPENTLQYLLYQSHSKYMVQSSLCHNVEYLNIYTCSGLKHNYQDKEKQFYIYDWLYAFPSLKKLKITNLWLIHEYQLMNPHQNLKQKFVACNKITYFLSPCYQLTELNLKNCRICLDLSDMTRFLETLSNLHSLYINDAWFSATPVLESLTISAPHLNLCNLQLSNLKYAYLNCWPEPLAAEYKYYDIKEVKVKEISSNSSFKVQRDPSNVYIYIPNRIFTFVCNSVDNFWS
ncbi:hypothetical protein BJ944DRAFT_238890 [Cunninghamella echinulata]|nr:hypothetical protein BJ944DRAFT_238890 [Cunninghamella echinulata]